jgi:isocitrate lyase
MLPRIAFSGARQVIAWRFPLPQPRSLCTTLHRMAAPSLQTVSPPISTELPSDAFQLLPESEKAGQAEDALYEQQLKDVKAWWATSRYMGIKRPYSAVDVVSKRGSQMQSYPSSVMARKLFNLLKEKEAKGEPLYTRARRPTCHIYNLC